MRPRAASAPAKNGGGSSLSFVSRAVRKLAASSTRHASLARAKSTIAETAGRYASSRSTVPPLRTWRSDVPPVEDRIREPVSTVDEDEIEGTRLPPREDLVRGPYEEPDAAVVDAQFPATAADTVLFAGIGCDGLVDRACGGEDDGTGARAGLERRPSPLHVPLEPLERGPGEAPVLAGPMQAGWRGTQGVGDGRGRHAGILREMPLARDRK